MSPTVLAGIKCALALLACAALAFEVWSRRHATAARWILRACALLAVLAYFQFGAVFKNGFVHRWEQFHYYLGAKYARELGYEGLYACVAEVDAQDHIPGAETRLIRDLRNDQLIRAASARQRAACGRAFSAARFEEFRRDVRLFRRSFKSRKVWEDLQRDHGYNPPPLWTVVGRSLSSLSPPTHSFLVALASLDVLLMAGAIGLMLVGFGEKVALSACVFWGTQAASEFGWTGGGFLRQDWLFCAVLGLCLLARKQMFYAGIALAAATLLRFFPGVLVVGPLASIAASLWARRRLLGEQRRFLAGAGLAAFVLLGVSIASVGLSAHLEFLEHIVLRHTSVISNHMGLRTLFAFSPAERLASFQSQGMAGGGAAWVAARQARLEMLTFPWAMATVCLALGVVLVCARTKQLWMCLALALPLVPALTDPSCYYYSIWILALALGRSRPAVLVPLLGVAAAGQLLCMRYQEYDVRFAALSLLYVVSAVVLLLAFRRESAVTRLARMRGNAEQKRLTHKLA